MDTEDVESLVVAHEKVMEALNNKTPRLAAEILCKEFNWLLTENGSFWEDVHTGVGSLSDYKKYEREILTKITRLVDDEEAIFARLGIDASRTGPIIASVYGGLRSATDLDDDPNRDTLNVLKDRLGKATELVCRESKGPIRHACDWLLSWKGATVMAGAAIVGANIAIGITADSGAISWMSVKVGVKVMRGDIEGIIDLFG